MPRPQLTFRIRLLSGFIVMVALLLTARLYYIQIANAALYEERAERQYVHTKADVFSRGSIYFETRDGEKLSAAAVRAGFVLAVNPQLITDAGATCATLQPHLSISEELCVERSQ